MRGIVSVIILRRLWTPSRRQTNLLALLVFIFPMFQVKAVSRFFGFITCSTFFLCCVVRKERKNPSSGSSFTSTAMCRKMFASAINVALICFTWSLTPQHVIINWSQSQHKKKYFQNMRIFAQSLKSIKTFSKYHWELSLTKQQRVKTLIRFCVAAHWSDFTI